MLHLEPDLGKLPELGHFTCPVCGYSWKDALELFRGVWDEP